ncbi:MAG: hypothetical protein V1725_01305 [archaeon]
MTDTLSGNDSLQGMSTLNFTIQNDLKQLSDQDAVTHLTKLKDMLGSMVDLISKKLPVEVGGNNQALLQYMARLRSSLDLVLLRNIIEAKSINGDIKQDCAIDPSESGYPVIMRDMYVLEQDKATVQQQLAALPSAKQIVERADYLLRRKLYPSDMMLAMHKRLYLERLAALDIPVTRRLHELEVVKRAGEKFKLIQNVEVLDPYNNIPHFYTLYLDVPEKSIRKKEWQAELAQTVAKTLEGMVGLELQELAEAVDAIEGVQVRAVERYDLGPFFTKFTNNNEAIAALIQDKDHAILCYQRMFVTCIEEQEVTGIGKKWDAWKSGDRHIGVFSDVVASPRYMLMPHVLIPEVHNHKLDLGKAMIYGIDTRGDILG